MTWVVRYRRSSPILVYFLALKIAFLVLGVKFLTHIWLEGYNISSTARNYNIRHVRLLVIPNKYYASSAI